MKRFQLGILVVIGVLAASVVTLAQEKKMEMPKPAPETKKLEVFAGKWTGSSEMKESAFGPAGKMTSSDDCTWFDGGFALVCRSTATGPMGTVKGMGIMSYNSEDKVYRYYGFDSMGMAQAATGTVSGNTWTWSGEDKMGGKLIKSRYTIVETSPKGYTFKWETHDGTNWNAVMEGKSNKK